MVRSDYPDAETHCDQHFLDGFRADLAVREHGAIELGTEPFSGARGPRGGGRRSLAGRARSGRPARDG
ncbi:MAG TPA: hypothetical protein VEJ42_11375 [Streptosporangiaceae bacterium]|nr:hypothetical protein [Streptosporangiaceae bacterium]